MNINDITFWLCFVLFQHWFADFILQTREQAVNKSKSFNHLAGHVLSYTVWITIVIWIVSLGHNGVNSNSVIVWGFINGLLHFLVDFFTSKSTAKYWNNGQPAKDFWTWIGLDQWLHTVILIITWITIVM
jgi:hypothetical protein